MSNAIILTTEQFETIVQRLNSLETLITEQKQGTTDHVVNNQDFCVLMKVSKRTAQKWRDEGIIPFRHIGRKIYYRQADIDEALAKNVINRRRRLGKF